MSFGRHRVQETTNKPVLKNEPEKKPVQDLIKKPFALEGDIVIHKEALTEEKPEEIIPALIEEPKVSISANTDTLSRSTRSPQVTEKKEEIKKQDVKERKKREDKKVYTNIGIIGDTVECRDFRAIVKKKGLQINNVLTDILHKYNTENYSVL